MLELRDVTLNYLISTPYVGYCALSHSKIALNLGYGTQQYIESMLNLKYDASEIQVH